MSKIRATYIGTGVEIDNYGKSGVLRFADLMEDGEPLTNKYDFGSLKKIKKLKLRQGEVIEFEATVNKGLGGRSVQIKNLKEVRRADIKDFEEGLEYCINKFLKAEKKLTKKEADNERLAFSRMVNQFGSDLDFWKYVALPFKLNSLHWFNYNLEALSEQKKKFDKANKGVDIEKKEIVLEENKIGEKVLIKKKQTLMGFMK